MTLSGTNADTNFVRYSITDAPDGSALKTKLDASGKAQSQVHDGDLATPYDLKPDKGGRYTFLVEEFTRGVSSNGGGYQGAPESAPSETKLAETTLTLEVGQKVETTLGFSPDTAKLVLYVWGDTVRATSIGVHKIETPAITSATTQKARNAAEYSTLQTAVAALAGEDAEDIIGSISTTFSAMRTAVDGHLNDGTVHNNADTYNQLGSGYAASSPAAAGASIAELRRRLERHFSNTDATGAEQADVHDTPYYRARFAAPGASASRLSQIVALADMYRVYDLHRSAGAPIHNSADSGNAPPSLPPLMSIHKLFIEQLETTSVSAPDSDNPGAALLAQDAGFTLA